jgi:hypothetical protein
MSIEPIAILMPEHLKGLPKQKLLHMIMTDCLIGYQVSAPQLLVYLDLARDKSEARRLIAQGAFRTLCIDGQPIRIEDSTDYVVVITTPEDPCLN